MSIIQEFRALFPGSAIAARGFGAHRPNRFGRIGLLRLLAAAAAVALVLTHPAQAPAQTGWTSQNSGVGFVLAAVHFVDASQGWVVSKDGGTILHSADGGETWNSQYSRGNLALRDVFFFDASNGWAVGDDNSGPPDFIDEAVILRTSDGGSNWSEYRTGLAVPLIGVHFVSTDEGWAAGGSGTLLHTTDGGAGWLAQNSGTQLEIEDVFFLDASMGIIAGQAGLIKRSGTGGINWSQRSIGLADYFTRLSFVPGDPDYEGWAAGQSYTDQSNGLVFKTIDNGVTWSQQASIDSMTFSGVHFVDVLEGWVVGQNAMVGGGVIYHTSNGGSTWTQQTYDAIVPNLSNVYMIDVNTGWIVGDSGVILKTTSGGDVPTAVGHMAALPLTFALEQNYPNPLNPATVIDFALPRAGPVTLKILDLRGREIATVVDADLSAGTHSATFHAGGLASGVYLYRIVSGEFVAMRKMLVVK